MRDGLGTHLSLLPQSWDWLQAQGILCGFQESNSGLDACGVSTSLLGVLFPDPLWVFCRFSSFREIFWNYFLYQRHFILLFQLFDWHIQLDKSLPAPLGTIGAWLYRAEVALREEITIQQVHEETAKTIQRKLEQHKVKFCLGTVLVTFLLPWKDPG